MTISCSGCQREFASKNALFRHLRVTAKTCLSDPDEYKAFCRFVLNDNKNLEKIAVLYGYVPADEYIGIGVNIASDAAAADDDDVAETKTVRGVRDGEHAAQLVLEAIRAVSTGSDGGGGGGGDGGGDRDLDDDVSKKDPSLTQQPLSNRSYGSTTKGAAIAQDANTGAVTEVLATRVPPFLLPSEEKDESASTLSTQESKAQLDALIEHWVLSVNRELQRRMDQWNEYDLSDNHVNNTYHKSVGRVKVFGRVSIAKKFNAEEDVSHRRMEYLLPADFLFPPSESKEHGSSMMDNLSLQDEVISIPPNRQAFFEYFPWFQPGEYSREGLNHRADHSIQPITEGDGRPNAVALRYLYQLKRIMQTLTTQIVELDANDTNAVMEKDFHDRKRKKQRNHRKDNNDHQNTDVTKTKGQKQLKLKSKTNPKSDNDAASDTGTGTATGTAAPVKVNVLQRKRYHNFTPKLMAHEFLVYRRLDRFYHRSTARFTDIDKQSSRRYLSLALKGDIFLNGQAPRVIGLFIAVVRGVIDAEIVDCVFDEDYTDLVPVLPAPLIGLYAGEASYVRWEGKTNAILSARPCNRYDRGWNNPKVLQSVRDWTQIVQQDVVRAWCREGYESESGRLIAEKRWTEEVLNPWAIGARQQLQDYRRWKAAKVQVMESAATNESKTAESSSGATTVAEALLPALESIDSTVPQLFERVLYFLRQADESGLWPSTTPKRQLVMVSTDTTEDVDGSTPLSTAKPSLAAAHMKAKLNKQERKSAYAFNEGEGGASGSFSVGIMPGQQCEQPKGNILFPELMRAAFELEIALCPGREPSSTIAINRNAQFRPHTDSGAGAGQSTSLIVGLGKYAGGELMVEGTKCDIRYKAIEFNGWKQRHWTLPFRGERFSLVWFTPKGCEGAKGIDICK